MNSQASVTPRAGERLWSIAARPTVLLIGDGLVGPFVESFAGEAGRGRAFVPNRFPHWLRILMPGIDLAEAARPGGGAETTVMLARRIEAIAGSEPYPEAALISTGLEDCLATMTGVAPSLDESVAALEAIATRLLTAGIQPVFLIPPPSHNFSNGLFAERHIAIAATLRRMARQDERIAVIDPTGALRQERSFGIEPDPRFISPDGDGRLTVPGAFRLAEVAAEQLGSFLPTAVDAAPQALDFAGAINRNPELAGGDGSIPDAAAGNCPTGYRLDCHATDRASIAFRPDGTHQVLAFSGPYTTDWGFVRLSQDIPPEMLADLGAGDVIEALCHLDLRGEVRNIAAVSLHVTPVWQADFLGLHSQRYVGGPGLGKAFSGCLRTPPFRLPGKLVRLHASLSVHLVPGRELPLGGELAIRSLILRRTENPGAKQ